MASIRDEVRSCRGAILPDNLQGVCKDCGNGTLNNKLNPAFDVEGNYDHPDSVVCNRCGSAHLDLVVL